MKLTIQTLVRSSVVMSLLGLAAGCANSHPQPSQSSHFFPEQVKVQNIMELQVAAGAREDATLQALHFDGTRLNSLGSEKLARMVPENQQDNLVVYLNVPGDASLAARRDAVTNYLGMCGLEASRLKIEVGSNPNLTTPSAYGMERMIKTESTGESSGSSAGTAMSSTPQSAAK